MVPEVVSVVSLVFDVFLEEDLWGLGSSAGGATAEDVDLGGLFFPPPFVPLPPPFEPPVFPLLGCSLGCSFCSFFFFHLEGIF